MTRQIRNQAMAVATHRNSIDGKGGEGDGLQGQRRCTGGGWSGSGKQRWIVQDLPDLHAVDQQRWDQGDSSRPEWPLHPNCRCQAVLVDPEDTEFADQARTAVVIREKEQGPLQADQERQGPQDPTRVKGQQFYRKTTTVTSDTPPPRYADVLAKWAGESNTSLVEAMGEQRAAYFKRQLDEFNRDPQQILESMLRGKPGEQQWIPIERLKEKRATTETNWQKIVDGSS